jgi:hypothetical protein
VIRRRLPLQTERDVERIEPGRGRRDGACRRQTGVAEASCEPPPAQRLGGVVAHGWTAAPHEAQGEGGGDSEGEQLDAHTHEVVAGARSVDPSCQGNPLLHARA